MLEVPGRDGQLLAVAVVGDDRCRWWCEGRSMKAIGGACCGVVRTWGEMAC